MSESTCLPLLGIQYGAKLANLTDSTNTNGQNRIKNHLKRCFCCPNFLFYSINALICTKLRSHTSDFEPMCRRITKKHPDRATLELKNKKKP